MQQFVRAAFMLALAGYPDAMAQSQADGAQPPINPPSAQPTQPPASDQRGTDQMPFTVKVLPGPKSAKETDQEQRDRRQQDEKALIDKRLADETGNLAAYTLWLAGFTLLLFFAAVVQLSLFWWQLRLIGKSLRDTKVSADAATAGAIAAREAAHAARLNAEALISTERAHLFVVVREDSLRPSRSLGDRRADT